MSLECQHAEVPQMDVLFKQARGLLYVSLHLADPSLQGVQTAYELRTPGYRREAMTREGKSALFPVTTDGRYRAQYFGLGLAEWGPGKLVYVGKLPGA
jgi:hypothetical protein